MFRVHLPEHFHLPFCGRGMELGETCSVKSTCSVITAHLLPCYRSNVLRCTCPPSRIQDLQRALRVRASAQTLVRGTLGKMPAHPNDYRVDTTKLPQGGLLLKKTGWRKLRDDGNLRPGSKLMVAMEDSAVAMEVDALFAVADAQAAEEARAAEALEAARLAASKQGRSTSRLSSQSSRSVLVTGKLAHARAEPSERTQGPFDYFPRSPEWLANKHQQKNGARPQSRAPVRALTLEQRQFEAKRRLAAQAIASRFQAPQKDPAPSALEFSAASLAALATCAAEPISGPPPSRRPSGHFVRTDAWAPVWADGPPEDEPPESPPRPPAERSSKSTAARSAPADPPARPNCAPGLSSTAPPLRLPSRAQAQDDLFGKGPAEHAAADSRWFREALRHDALPARHVWPTKWKVRASPRAPPPPPRAPPAPVYRAAPMLSHSGPAERPDDAPAASSSAGAAAAPAPSHASRPVQPPREGGTKATTRPASAVVRRPSLDATLSQGLRRPGSAAILHSTT